MLNLTSPRRFLGVTALSSALLLGACASDLGAGSYSRSSVGQISRSDSGVIMSSRPIRIEGTKSGVGTVGGAAIGGLAGSELGGDNTGRAVGAIVGAIAGGLLGSAVEKSATESQGFSYSIRLDRDGEYISIAQAGGDYPIPNGTPVWVEYGERTRVIPKAQAGYQDPYSNPAPNSEPHPHN